MTSTDVLNRRAQELASQDLSGWLSPAGDFTPCIETGGQIMELSLGRHEATALEMLSAHPELMRELDQRRRRRGCRTWPETSRYNLIKEFMRERGFVRVSPDILSLDDLD
jgi:hypothetical protein